MEILAKSSSEEKWALVELVGYQQFAGNVSDESINGKQYIRVEVPETKVHKAFDCKFGIESVHHIRYITKEQAETIIRQRERGRFALNFCQLVALGARS
jgi:hypothetical protein